MGNFSQDPRARAVESIGKHYISVRLQQGVPILDADWNLLEDLRRLETETFGKWFAGDGVPAGSDGFHILAAGAANDFVIRQGICLVSGKLARNDADVNYTTQPDFGDATLNPPLPALTTPAANKQFIVYLDVWEREVDSLKDPNLVDIRIGVETAVRLKRDWAVRVASVPEDLALLSNPPAGHSFLQIAQLNRVGGNANITASMIVDLRDTQLSIRRKIEVLDAGNNVIVSNQRFLQMLQAARNNIFALIQYVSTQYNPNFSFLTAAETLAFAVTAHVAQTAEAGLAQLNSRNMANAGALAFLSQLYDSEQRLMTTWRDVLLQLGFSVKKYASYQGFVTSLDAKLNQGTGLLPSLQLGDLAAATTAQEQINLLFGTAAASVPRGSVQVFLANSPTGVLTLGQVARFQFRVKSFTTQADTYTVLVQPPGGWPRLVVDATGTPVPNNKISVGPSGTETTVFVDATVQAGSSGLQLRVTSDSNPAEIDQTSGLFTLTLGQAPPVGDDKVQFRIENPFHATINPATGVVAATRSQLASIAIRVFNNTGAAATFALALDTVPGSQLGTWTIAYTGDTSVPVANGASVSEGMNITPGADAVSTQLRFTATTTIAGAPVSGQIIVPWTAS